jgi:hypothetical protein
MEIMFIRYSAQAVLESSFNRYAYDQLTVFKIKILTTTPTSSRVWKFYHLLTVALMLGHVRPCAYGHKSIGIPFWASSSFFKVL